LTTSQQATPCALALGLGLELPLHRRAGLGQVERVHRSWDTAPTMYIVLPATIGAASWPRSTPVENVNAGFSCADVGGRDLASGL
jgi:hypothetical protein